jgi:hypothetical protein
VVLLLNQDYACTQPCRPYGGEHAGTTSSQNTDVGSQWIGGLVD